MSSSDPVVVISGLSKHYGDLAAVSDLTLEVRPGEIFGFLGLNGAGKTTTIRVLLDLLRPTRGSVRVLGWDCQKHGLQVRRGVGYLPGELGLYADLTGKETLDFLARLGGRQPDTAYRSELQERLKLPDGDLRRKLREYSTGMKRKLGILQSFEADPPLLILDEPTEGLDPLMREAFYELLAEVRRRGTTVFMSSHVLSEVERVCDRIGLLRQGKLAVLSTVEELRALAARRVQVRFSEDVAPAQDAWRDGHEWLLREPRLWSLRVRGPLGPFLRFLHPLPVEDLRVEEPRVEDVLIRYYKEGSS